MLAAATLLLPTALAAPVGDRVHSVPGISNFPTDWAVYSGCAFCANAEASPPLTGAEPAPSSDQSLPSADLAVPGPIPSACSPSEPYDSLSIHYQLNEVQDPTKASAPVVAWRKLTSNPKRLDFRGDL